MQRRIELINGKFFMRGDKEEKKETETIKQKPAIKEYSEEALALRDRVIKGNQKLYDAWCKICELDHESQEWRDELEQWHQATEKLSILCSNLQGMGYCDCLYLEGDKRTKSCLKNPDGFFCLSCPSEYPYWGEDARELLFNNKEGD